MVSLYGHPNSSSIIQIIIVLTFYQEKAAAHGPGLTGTDLLIMFLTLKSYHMNSDLDII